MKALPKLFFALTAVAALSFASSAKANLITNGGFETGDLSGWSSINFFVVGTPGSIAPHSGNFQAFSNGGGVLGQLVATTLGQSYTVDLWVATISPGTLSGFVGGSTIFSHIFAGPTGYTEFMFTFTATSTSSLIQFQDAGFFYFDDISVEPAGVGVPDGGTTASLLGCALVGLAGLRRRLGC